MGIDVIIADRTFQAGARRAKYEASSAETTLSCLISLLDMICDSDMTEGTVAKNFRAYTEQVRGLKGRLQEILDDEAAQLETFISEVDAADDYVYGDGTRNGASTMNYIRDFTDAQKEELVAAIKESDEMEAEIASYRREVREAVGMDPPSHAAVADALRDLWEIEQAFMDAASELEKIMYYNNSTVEQIESIWAKARELDEIYGARFSGIHDVLVAYTNTVNALAEMINGDAAKLNATFRQPTDVFAAQCGQITKGLETAEIDYEEAKMYLPDGSYNWEYITSLFQAGEATPAVVAALARIYSKMNEEDMERFFAAGYIPQKIEDETSPNYVLSPLMAQVCQLFSVQVDILTLLIFDDAGNPRPGVTPEQVHEAQLQMLRAGIIRDVCTYGQEIHFNGNFGDTEGCGPVDITQFGVDEYPECGKIYTYKVTLRHHYPYDPAYDGSTTWASQFMGTGMITAGKAREIYKKQIVALVKALNGNGEEAAWGLAAGLGGIVIGLMDLIPASVNVPIDILLTIVDYQQRTEKLQQGDNVGNAMDVVDGLEMLGASARTWYNPATMQMEIRYITYDESEAYLRYRAFIEQLPQGADKPGFTEFVKVLQSGGIQNPPQESQLFDEVVAWYNGSTSRSQVEEQTKKYRVALEHAKVARPDIAWPENLRDCTLEQMTHLLFYM